LLKLLCRLKAALLALELLAATASPSEGKSSAVSWNPSCMDLLSLSGPALSPASPRCLLLLLLLRLLLPPPPSSGSSKLSAASGL
jgi:hypothetical protein